MSEPNNIDVQNDLKLLNISAPRDTTEGCFRNPVPSTSTTANTMALPPLPPRPDMGPPMSYGMNGMQQGWGGMGSYGMGNYGGYGYGGMGGSYGMGAMGMGAMGPYGGYNRFGGPMYGDMESRFIQMAEESSRPAFDSIQSLINAVGSIAMMLENTFFALTSSFRAILGVAENFGRLRTVFAQFWSTFAVIRTLNWIIRKLLVLLGIRTESEFKAWAEAVAATQVANGSNPQNRGQGSSWPILLFFGVIAAAPYIVLKMLSGLNKSLGGELNDPATWQNPLRAIALHDFQATRNGELSFSANQVLSIAPQHLQSSLWNSGWLMASADRRTAGLIPLPYIKITHMPQNETAEKKENPDFDKYYEQQ